MLRPFDQPFALTAPGAYSGRVEQRGVAFRISPVDGPATFPRVVKTSAGKYLTVLDSGWKRTEPFDWLDIVPADLVAPAVSTVLPDAEQWHVEIAEDECDRDPSPLELPRSQLIMTRALTNLNGGAALAPLMPALDLRAFRAVGVAGRASAGSGGAYFATWWDENDPTPNTSLGPLLFAIQGKPAIQVVGSGLTVSNEDGINGVAGLVRFAQLQDYGNQTGLTGRISVIGWR